MITLKREKMKCNVANLLVFSILTLLSINISFAQESDEGYKITNKGLVKTSYEDTVKKELVVFKPELIFKVKYEAGTESSESRFIVRNSRLGFSGNANEFVSYKFMLELSSEGNFSVLDLYGSVKISDRLKANFGQGSIPLYNSYTISPSQLDYANRPFVGKYFVSTRDIGLTLNYQLKKEGYPIGLEGGVYNGTGINNPVWATKKSYGARVTFGELSKGVRVTAKSYRSNLTDTLNLCYWGADFRYKAERFKVETEIMNKYNYYDKNNLFASYMQGAYIIPVVSNAFKYIEPMVRWDAMGYNVLDDGFGVNRLTFGVNFIFNTKNIISKIILDYEHYFHREILPMFTTDEMAENKLSVELLIYF